MGKKSRSRVDCSKNNKKWLLEESKKGNTTMKGLLDRLIEDAKRNKKNRKWEWETGKLNIDV